MLKEILPALHIFSFSRESQRGLQRVGSVYGFINVAVEFELSTRVSAIAEECSVLQVTCEIVVTPMGAIRTNSMEQMQ